MATATHQQNGQHWGNANGNHGAQKPNDVGTAVRSTCQTWLGRFAVTTRVDGAASPRPGCGSSFKIRPTVVTPGCNPARHSVSAILTFPILGLRVFRRCTMQRTKSGNLFTGSRSCNSASVPLSSMRFTHNAMVADVTRNVSAVCLSDQPRAARSSRIAMRS